MVPEADLQAALETTQAAIEVARNYKDTLTDVLGLNRRLQSTAPHTPGRAQSNEANRSSSSPIASRTGS
jgi:hypothetical protein